MLASGIEEVETVLGLFDRNRVLICIVLEDDLFQIQEGTLVVYFLTYLHQRSPHVLGSQTTTGGTLGVLDHIFYLENLLQYGGSQNLGANNEQGAPVGFQRD